MITDLINIIDKLAFNKYLSTILYMALLIGLLYKPIISFFYGFKRNKINKLNEAYKFDGLDTKTKNFISESLSEEYFKLATGLSGNKNFRTELIKLYEKNNFALEFMHYKRVFYYMKYKNNRFKCVRIGKIEQLFGYLLAISGFYILFVAVTLLFILYTLPKGSIKTTSDVWLALGLFMLTIIFMFIGSIFILRPLLIYRSSKFVNRQIGDTGFTCLYHRYSTKRKRFKRITLFYILIPEIALFLLSRA